jgi:hypothetical protein
MEPLPPTARTPSQTKLNNSGPDNWTDAEHGLREALCIWREQAAGTRWGHHHMVGGIGIISNDQIKRIVSLARQQLIPSISDLQRELKWLYMAQYGAEVLSIVHSSHPPPKPQMESIATTPLSTTGSGISPSNTPSQKKPRIVRCSACHELGHNSKLILWQMGANTHTDISTQWQA